MDFTIPPVVTYFVSWAATIAGIWLIFEKAEEVVNPSAKARVSSWLQYLDPSARIGNWPSTFAAMFDQIFGKNRRSLRFVSISIVQSLISVVIVAAISGILHEWLTDIGSGGVPVSIVLAVALVGGPLVFNFLPDYLSLIETRYVLDWVSGRHPILRGFAFLAIDSAITGAIGFLPVALFIWANNREMDMAYQEIRRALRLSPEGFGFYGMYIYSTFSTSALVWVYFFSLLALKLVGEFFNLDIKDKPLRSVGLVFITVVSVAFVVAVFYRG